MSGWSGTGGPLAVIPARIGSTRLPGKALLSDTGRALIQHVVESVRKAPSLDKVIVATDDARIARAAEASGARAIMTRPDHPTGTDRILEVVRQLDQGDPILNIQGDEPEVDPTAIEQLLTTLDSDPEAPVATLVAPIRNQAERDNPARVKVAMNQTGRALLFSRSPIPYHRQVSENPDRPGALGWLHLGLYAYRRSFLLGPFPQLPRSELEACEQLEQLRILEAGYPIAIGRVEHYGHGGIDTPEDYRRFVNRFQNQSRNSAA